MTSRNEDGTIVGVARPITDFAYHMSLSDLPVDVAFQRRVVRRDLIQSVRKKSGLDTRFILLLAPAAEGYYPHIGIRN